MFSELSGGAKDFVLFNHSYISKWFVLTLLIILSVFYVFFIWPRHRPTKFITILLFRIFFITGSVSVLVASPYLIFYLDPTVTFSEFYQLPIALYSIVISFLGLALFVDFFRYGFFVLLELAGFDMNDPKVKEIKREIDKSKHGVRIK